MGNMADTVGNVVNTLATQSTINCNEIENIAKAINKLTSVLDSPLIVSLAKKETLMDAIHPFIQNVYTQSANGGGWIALTAIATVASAIAAVIVLIFNNRSINQVKLSQQLNANIRLFEKRHDVYCHLQRWCNIAESAIDNANGDSNKVRTAFYFGLMSDFGDPTFISLGSELHEAGEKQKRNAAGVNPEHSEPAEEPKGLDKDAIDQIRPHYMKMRFYITESVRKIQSVINTAKYLFPLDNDNRDKIEDFTDVFFNISKSVASGSITGIEYVPELEKALKKLTRSRILQNMEDELDKLRKLLLKS